MSEKTERIYLQVTGDPEDGTVTWCEDPIYDDDVAYVLESELKAVKKENEQLQRNFEQLDFQHSAVCKELKEKKLTIDQMKNEIEARGRANTELKKERDELEGWANKLCKEVEVLNKTRSVRGVVLQWRIIFEVIDRIASLSKEKEGVKDER